MSLATSTHVTRSMPTLNSGTAALRSAPHLTSRLRHGVSRTTTAYTECISSDVSASRLASAASPLALSSSDFGDRGLESETRALLLLAVAVAVGAVVVVVVVV